MDEEKYQAAKNLREKIFHMESILELNNSFVEVYVGFGGHGPTIALTKEFRSLFGVSLLAELGRLKDEYGRL